MSAPKFKIWNKIRWGYAHAFRNIPLIFKAGWPGMVLLTFLTVVIGIAAESDIFVPHVASTTFGLLAIAHFSVAWHRNILLGDRQAKTIRFGRAEFMYFLIPMALVVFDAGIEYLPAATGLAGLEFAENGTGFLTVRILTFTLIAIITSVVFMVLPGIAVNDQSMTVDRAWRMWRGNRWRFYILVIVAAVIAGFLLEGVVNGASVLSRILIHWLDIGHGSFDSYSLEWWYYLAALVAPEPLVWAGIYLLWAAFAGMLSVSYATIAKRALAEDPDYAPPPALRRRLERGA